MKYVSKTLKVSETAFVFPSENADYKVRFFSPELEVDLCGHATVATFFTLAVKGAFSEGKNVHVTQETKAGILPVDIYSNDGGKVDRVMMAQGKSEFKDIYLDISTIADSLNISVDEIDDSFPKQIVST